MTGSPCSSSKSSGGRGVSIACVLCFTSPPPCSTPLPCHGLSNTISQAGLRVPAVDFSLQGGDGPPFSSIGGGERRRHERLVTAGRSSRGLSRGPRGRAFAAVVRAGGREAAHGTGRHAPGVSRARAPAPDIGTPRVVTRVLAQDARDGVEAVAPTVLRCSRRRGRRPGRPRATVEHGALWSIGITGGRLDPTFGGWTSAPRSNLTLLHMPSRQGRVQRPRSSRPKAEIDRRVL